MLVDMPNEPPVDKVPGVGESVVSITDQTNVDQPGHQIKAFKECSLDFELEANLDVSDDGIHLVLETLLCLPAQLLNLFLSLILSKE